MTKKITIVNWQGGGTMQGTPVRADLTKGLEQVPKGVGVRNEDIQGVGSLLSLHTLLVYPPSRMLGVRHKSSSWWRRAEIEERTMEVPDIKESSRSINLDEAKLACSAAVLGGTLSGRGGPSDSVLHIKANLSTPCIVAKLIPRYYTPQTSA